jgi:hypothetical protein
MDVGVPLGGQLTRQLTIRNQGGSPLLCSIQEALGAGSQTERDTIPALTDLVETDVPWLAVSPTSVSVSAGSSTDIQLQFDASSGASSWRTAYVIVVSNDSIRQSLVVPIRMGIAPLGVNDPTSIRGSQLTSYGPCPTRGTVRFEVAIAAGDAGSLRITDVLGRIVRTYRWNGDSGRRSIVWDGAGEDGVKARAGIYLVRFAAGQTSVVRRIVVTP